MEWNKEQLAIIEAAGAAGYLPNQVAFMVNVTPAAFKAILANDQDPATIAYFKSYLTSELKIRESIMNLARSGSSPAQAQALKIFENANRQLRKQEYPGFDAD